MQDLTPTAAVQLVRNTSQRDIVDIYVAGIISITEVLTEQLRIDICNIDLCGVKWYSDPVNTQIKQSIIDMINDLSTIVYTVQYLFILHIGFGRFLRSIKVNGHSFLASSTVNSLYTSIVGIDFQIYRSL